MAYVTDIIDLPLGSSEISCSDQHAAYQAEKARVSQLVSQLTPLAANCHHQVSEYSAALSRYEDAKTAQKHCADSILSWTLNKKKYDEYLVCERQQKVSENYQILVNKIKAKNSDSRTAWLAQVATINSKNTALNVTYSKQIAEYNKAFLSWKKKDEAYRNYLSVLSSQSASIEASWKATLQQNPFLTGYNWNYRTVQCGQTRQCMTQAKKDSLQSTCNPIRGLGDTSKSNATTCMTRQYYPTCPECPPTVGPPGAHPVQPSKPTYYAVPSEPTYEKVPTWQEYLRSKGIPNDVDCAKVKVSTDPGPAPTCNPDSPLPGLPAKPTCTPPNIPVMPVEPSCKKGIFAQVGTLWLLAAIGAGGIYWYSRGK